MPTLWQDVRYAARMLRANLAFTAVAILSLAIGIGANTTIFSLVNAVLLRPLPGVARVEQLVDVHATAQDGSSYHVFSYPDYEYLRDRSDLFDGLTAYGQIPVDLNAGDRAERIAGLLVTGNYFDVLGTRAARGRLLTPEDDRTPGAHPVAVISHRLWQQRFAGDMNIIGKTATLNGHVFSIIGVAPEGFTGTWVGLTNDVWLPVLMQREVSPRDSLGRQTGWLQLSGRLKEGVGMEAAQAQLSVLAQQLAAQFPETNRGEGVDVQPMSRVPGEVQGAVFGFLGMLTVVVGLVLLIACANVAGMSLARAVARRKEIAIRLALGAPRGRIVRQLLTESMLLFVIGGIAGALVAVWTTDLLLAFTPPDVPLTLNLNLDARVLAYTLIVSLATGIIFGLAPALQATKADVLPALKEDGASEGLARRSRLRSWFVVGQIAVSLVLLIAAGLFFRSLRNAALIDPGFNPEGVQVVTFDLATRGYDETRGREFYRQLTERVRALPGVEAASLASLVPLGGQNRMNGISVEGHTPPNGAKAFYVNSNTIDADYLPTLQIPLRQGRNFNASDVEGAARTALVNETFARRFFNGDAVGGRFGFGAAPATPVEIVGVVADGKYETLGETARPAIFLPFAQNYSPGMTLQVRTGGDAGALMNAIRREANVLDKDLPFLNAMPMTERIGFSLIPLRLAASVVGVLGCLGLLLAGIGVHGVIAYSVAQRTRELGIRRALGAQDSDVLRLVVSQGLRLTALGVALGLLGAFALTRFLSNLLYGIGALDPIVFVGVPLLLALVALIACYIPARRAMKVDPMVALRYE
ncbi:MAG: ABC transporter permease [Acidobacteria bacterium]|nr:ABC transporter permease [Acidobacteriota bacterium]